MKPENKRSSRRRGTPRRGRARQQRRLERERVVRRAAVVYARWCHRQGVASETAAERLHLSPSTLRRWETRWEQDRLEGSALGRPAERSERWTRSRVIALMRLMGPGVGLPTLKEHFPEVARGELRELLHRYRRLHRRDRRQQLHVLRWTRPGAVWAMDFGNPPAAIDAVYRKILAVRDLASGYQLTGLPCPRESVGLVVRILDGLVEWHGAPLVLKIDNGSSFIAHELKAWARRHQVTLLYSPPRTPEYNGSIEAGMGSLKVRALWHAAAHERAGHWTCDDVDAAVAEANETARPHGRRGPSPQQAWRGRIRITPDERAAFRSSQRRYERRERRARCIDPWVRLQHDEQASVDRVATGRALLAHGFLLIRRGRIAPSVFRKLARKIS